MGEIKYLWVLVRIKAKQQLLLKLSRSFAMVNYRLNWTNWGFKKNGFSDTDDVYYKTFEQKINVRLCELIWRLKTKLSL